MISRVINILVIVSFALSYVIPCECRKQRPQKAQTDFRSKHTNNWAVLVDTSRFWFNYRHSSNALSFYRTVKRLGIPDSQIILMLADDVACNPRNSFAGEVFNEVTHKINLYGDDIEVDYRGPEVTVESFLRVLLGRHDPQVPRSKRLLSDSGSNILLFLTGHGGEDFLKFQDSEEVLSNDIAGALAQMSMKGRYNELLMIADTCQAASLFSQLHSPGVLGVASSAVGESSYSHVVDAQVGLSVIDRFSYYTEMFLEPLNTSSTATLQDLVDHYRTDLLRSTPTLRTDLFHRAPLDKVLLTDFLGSVPKVMLIDEEYPEFEGVPL